MARLPQAGLTASTTTGLGSVCDNVANRTLGSMGVTDGRTVSGQLAYHYVTQQNAVASMGGAECVHRHPGSRGQ
eukprot:m.128611 g.128611  ORF g.128611 m.128611 type:complete len:74 (-) comp17430_c0_seq1:122-343(-)